MIWKKLFGTPGAGNAPLEKKAVQHNGYTIVPAPKRNDARFYTAGYIRKTVDGEPKEKYFIRADTYNDADDASDNAITKGRRIIDEQGDGLFD